MNDATFAAALRRHLDAEGITVFELAERSGVSRQSLGSYLNDGAEPTFRNVLKIAAALGATANDMAYGEEKGS